MSNLAADKVLRVNCPGWGVQSTLPLGEAKPLAMYEVIVINPASIVHLFEPKSDTARQIDRMLGDGASSLKVDSDSVLESVSAELELREHELRQFLSKGGLLVYFLSPSFNVIGPGMQMDNYLWLYESAPDRVEGNAHTMVASKGRTINVSARGKQHPFAPFLQQLGLEYQAYIRKDDLAPGYKSLASAGGGKSVSAYKSTGPRRGQVIFLPAPYETRFDDTLKECIFNWFDLHTGADADKSEPDIADDDEGEGEIEGRALLGKMGGDDEGIKSHGFSAPPAHSAAEPSDLDSLDSLFGPSKGKSFDSFDDDDPRKLFDEPPAKSKNAFDEPPSRPFDDTPPPAEKKKTNLDWPELENDIPPFAKEREREREREKERERERIREEERERERDREKERGREEDRERERERDRERAREEERDREREKERERAREEEREREREKAREEEREREREKERERAREDERERERTREEERERERVREERERERAREERERERAREEEHEREREKAREEEREREKERERERAREEDRERERERERERAREEERERERSREEEREREKARERARDEEREREREREREKAREEEKERERQREEERAREKAIEDRERERAREQDHEREKAREMQRELDRAREDERERQRAREEQREARERAGAGASGPEAKELMSRMEQEISAPGVPEWCQRVSFAELKQLHLELGDLNEQVRKARQKINDIEDRIHNLNELKDALLSLSGVRLTQACCKVLEALGWSVKVSESSAGEIWLNDEERTQAIVRIVFSSAQPNRSELAELAESVITYWGKYDVEPKGILVASTFAEKTPSQRSDDDFPGSMGEFARRKNLCLLTSLQLLTIYRDVTLKEADVRKIRENLLVTSGILSGHRLELSDMATAEAAAG